VIEGPNYARMLQVEFEELTVAELWKQKGREAVK
jgi:hypothetical protein